MDSFQDYHGESSGSGNPKERPKLSLDKSLFSPFVAHSLKVQGRSGFLNESACYNPKYNLIIACPGNSTVQFYDATTFEPCKTRGFLKLKGSVMQISFQPEIDTYLLGCASGLIYQYNVSKNELKELKRLKKEVLEITFLDSTFYALSLDESDKLYVGNVNDGTVVKFDLRCDASYGLHHLSKRKLLFSGLQNGFVRIYRTNSLPHLKAIGSIKTKGWTMFVQSFHVNGKEYLITANDSSRVKIWHLVKGQMRLLKVLQNEEGEFCSLVYLENYKMLATSCQDHAIKFWRFPSMKLEKTIELGEGRVQSLFLIKERNMIGVTNGDERRIDFIQLHHHIQENSLIMLGMLLPQKDY